MSQSDPATAVGADPKRTGVGSVFVSNYPPYSFWSADRVPEVQKMLGDRPSEQVDLGLYLHIPFCRKRCKFCYFKVYTEKNSQEVQSYLDAVARETEVYAKSPAIAGRRIKFVYFGGGTPSFISAKQLRGLVAGVKSRMDWSAAEEVTFECEPGTLTESKLEAIREIGVTRLSLGVENFNDRILEENGRAHLTREIRRVEPWIKKLDFDQLNIDLIAGMVGESWDSWKDTLRKTVEMDPDSVTIYQMELPFNTVYSKSVLDGSAVAVADWETKRAWHDYAFEQLAAAGYEISSAYTMVKRGRGGRFAYRDALWHGSDLLGVGVSAFSHVGGVHFQNLSRWDEYIDRAGKGELPIDRAYRPSEREGMIREMILQLKLGRLEKEYFASKFGVDILSEFAAAFGRLKGRKMLDWQQGLVTLTRQGLLRVDQLLPEFYEPQHQNSRYT